MALLSFSHWRQPWRIAVIAAALALLLRLPGLGSVMTVDEKNWMLRSAEFYDKVLATDAGGTFLTTHPGSIPMWLIGGGETLQERRVGLQVDQGNLTYFRKAAVAPMVLVAALLIGLITYLAARVWSPPVAMASGLLLAAEPYLVGMTTIAHLDGVQGLFMLASFLSGWLAIQPKRFHVPAALVAGVLWGLAMGFKLILALWLLPIFGLLLAVRAYRRNDWQPALRTLGFITGVAVFVFWLSWPALWVKADVGRSLTRDYQTTFTDEHVALEAGEEAITAQTFYIRTVLGRVTPHVQLLVLGSFIYVVLFGLRNRKRTASRNHELATIAWLLFYSVGFMVLITFAAKKADRYALPALVAWPVIAGWVAAKGYEVISSKQLTLSIRRFVLPTALCILLAAIIALPLLWLPHTLAYNNPFFPNIRPLSQQGWGEGLEAAAAWLNERPRANEMYIASWYPSVMETYFVGKTLSLSSRDDYRVQYLVTYRNMGGRAPDEQASDVLDEVRNREPAHVVTIAGVPYAWIYETFSVGNFTKHIGELAGTREVGQTVRPETDNWNAIEIGFATFSSRNNTEDVIVHVRESVGATADVRTGRVNARAIVDNEWEKFMWEPIPNSAGREFYVTLTSPTSTPGNAVTVRYTDVDVRPGQLYINGEPKPGDLAYRIEE